MVKSERRVFELLTAGASRHPEAIALRSVLGESLTYQQLLERVRRLRALDPDWREKLRAA